MAEMFSGNWIVDFPSAVLNNNVLYDRFFNEHHFFIEGSGGNDGPHSDLVPVAVSGQNWFVKLEWFNPLVGWLPNPVPLRRIRAAYTLQDGLIVFLQADNTIPGGGGIPFSSISLSCRNVDPKLNPWQPFVNPYNFILPKQGPQAEETAAAAAVRR